MIGIRHIWNGSNGGGKRAAIAAAFLAFMVLVPGMARAADTPRLTLAEEDGYGRMILSFQGDVPKYTAEAVSGILVVHFARPVSFSLQSFSREMPRYVAQAREDASGKTLRLALTTDFQVNARVAERSLYLDLIPPQWTGPAPKLPKDVLDRIAAARKAKEEAEAARKAAKAEGISVPKAPAPVLRVRAVNANAMTRLVFDWNQPVLYSLQRRGDLVTLTFDRGAKVDLAQLRVDPPPYVKDIRASEHQGKLVVQMKVTGKRTVRDFREDLSIVLDIGGDHTAAPNSGARGQAATETKDPDAQEKPAFEHAAAHTDKPLPEPAPERKAAHDETDAKAAVNEAAAAEAAQPTDVVPHTAPVRSKEGKVAVTLDAGPETSDLVFSWPDKVGAAVFEWAGEMWVVFDRKADFDTTTLPEDGDARVGTWRVVPLANGVAFAAKLQGPMLVGADAEGRDWRIRIGETLTSAGGPVTVSRSWQDDGKGVVTLALASAEHVIRVTDPVTRQRAIAVTAQSPVQGVHTPRNFIEFHVLQTVQGVAVVPIADDVNVAVAPQSVVISRKEGLTLSADVSDEDRARMVNAGEDGGQPEVSPGRIDIEKWAHAPAQAGKGFTAGRQYYQQAVAKAGFAATGEAWLDLARYFVGNRMGQEALAATDAAILADPSFTNSATYRAIRGAAEVLARRYTDAIDDLNAQGLDSDPYASGWRGEARAQRGEWTKARSEFALAGDTLNVLGPVLGARFRIDAAKAGLETGDKDFAQGMARALPDIPDEGKLADESVLLQARLAQTLGQPDDAKALYAKAGVSDDRKVEVEARFRLAELRYGAGEMDDKAFADELEKLRMEWRGDTLELSVLRSLANIRLKQGNIQAALSLMETVSLNFPNSDAAHVLAGRMSDVFANYFISGGGKDMQPVQALAFYYKFQQLTPVGQKGDEMIRHLADRLVQVDLLPQAAQLLDYQIQNRLHGGVAKAQVAARLAGIYLLDHKPKDALRALRETRQVQLPDGLREERRLLEARTLSELHQYDNALDLLAQMTDEKARLLRCDVLWDAARWPEAGAALEAGLDDGWKAEGPLDKGTRFDVMRAAIAYSMAQDEEGLSRLRRKFGAKMQQSPDASAFAAVSDPIDAQGGGAYRDAVRRIASVSTLDKFLKSLDSDKLPKVAVN